MFKKFKEMLKSIFSKGNDVKPSDLGINKEEAYHLLKGKENLKELENKFSQSNEEENKNN